MSIAFHNGVWVDDKSLSVSVNDYGFCRGYALYEFFRCYNNQPFCLRAHIERMFLGLEDMGLELPYTFQQIENFIFELIARNHFGESTVKLFVTAGFANNHDARIGMEETPSPSLFMINSPFQMKDEGYPYGRAMWEKGFALKSIQEQRIFPHVKSTNYVTAMKEGRKAIKEGFDDILFVEDGCVTETSRSNIFFVKKGVFITPKSGMLGGTTRKFLIDMIVSEGGQVEERAVHLSELSEMDECFITGSSIEMIPVRQIDGINYGSPLKMGMTKELFMKYRGVVSSL